MFRTCFAIVVVVIAAQSSVPVNAQPPESGGRFGGGFPGPGGPFGGREKLLVEEFDTNADGWLNDQERQAARESLDNAAEGEGPRQGRRPRFGGRNDREPPQPGPDVDPIIVENYPNADLYSPDVVRTVFIEFDSDDWEKELEAFRYTDVDIPAELIVDGKSYPGVGIHFRGMSSYGMVGAGYKRSLNVSLDLVDPQQRLYGYKTLNLLNCNGDPSMMSSVLYSHLVREHIPAPLANFVEVVINGKSWGIYANVQQFDKIFTEQEFGSSKGTRWKVPGSPRGDGGLRYTGEELDQYKSRFEMKSDDGNKSWQALVELCQVLNETPLDELQERIEPLLDIDETLWFLAYDVALVNSDGYWTRASDYYLFRDEHGVFHTIPHDMNEAFHMARRGSGGPGGGPRGGFGPPPGFDPPEGFRPPDGFGPPPEFGPPPGEEPREGFNRPRRFENQPLREPGEEDRDAQRNDPQNNLPGERGGRRRGFGPREGGPTLDPLVGIDEERMPLRSRLLQVPELRARYLEYVRQIAEQQLDWEKLGPLVAHCRKLILPCVEQDTRKLSTTEAFLDATATDDEAGESSLRHFVEQRSKFLREYQPTTKE